MILEVIWKDSVQAWGLAVEAKRGHRSNSILQQ